LKRRDPIEQLKAVQPDVDLSAMRQSRITGPIDKFLDVTLLLFIVGVVIGSYLLPNLVNPRIAWYWRALFGIGVGVLALITRRYR
jgi:hypothetical protein